jgi:cyclopropane fatty-acyl-phospholipid synthase-like methyltransferase
VRAMLKLAGMKKADIVYDLGCGDGRIVIAAAKTYGAPGVGIDIDPDRIREAKEALKRQAWKIWCASKRTTCSSPIFASHGRDPVSVAEH